MTHGEAEYIVAWLDRYFRGVNTYEDTRKALADAPRWLRLALAAFDDNREVHKGGAHQ